MKIKFAVIPSEHISNAQDISRKLQCAMESGEMSAVNQFTEALISLTDGEYSLSLTDEYWYRLIVNVRKIYGDFKSYYIVTKPQLETILAADEAELFADVSAVVQHALSTEGVVLQLPFDEEEIDVRRSVQCDISTDV